MSALAAAFTCLTVSAAHAEEPSNVVVPPRTQNLYIPVVARLYEQGRYEEALSKLEKARDWKSNGAQELLWLKLMQGMLQAELAPGEALETFKEALALEKQAQLPVTQGSRRLRKLFEQARSTLGRPADKEQLKQELELSARARAPSAVFTPPPRRHGLSVGVRGEVDMLGSGPTSTNTSTNTPAVTPAVSLGYTREKLGSALTVLVQHPSPGLRAEGQFHPLTLGWVRPYARLGATAFFGELDAKGDPSFLGGVSGRGVLGVDVQLTSSLYVFTDVAYEHFFTGGARYTSRSVLLSVGVGLFP